jgi:hypothetical protein
MRDNVVGKITKVSMKFLRNFMDLLFITVKVELLYPKPKTGVGN